MHEHLLLIFLSFFNSSLKPINEEHSMKSFLWQRNNWFIALGLFFLLAFSLAACGNNGSSKSSSTAGAGTSPLGTPSPNPLVKLGAQPCPDKVKDPAHWN